MNAMSEHDMRTCDSNIVEVLDVAAAGLAFNHLDLIFTLGGVSVDDYTVLTRELCDALQQLACAAHSETRSEAIAQAPISPTMPSLEQCYRFGDRSFSLLAQRRRQVVAFVHHALADGRSEPRLFDCPE